MAAAIPGFSGRFRGRGGRGRRGGARGELGGGRGGAERRGEATAGELGSGVHAGRIEKRRGRPREEEDEGEGAGRPRGVSRWSPRPQAASRRWRGGQPCVQHAGACCLNEEDRRFAKSPLGFGVF
jgi:hypothetical protein